MDRLVAVEAFVINLGEHASNNGISEFIPSYNYTRY